MGETGVSRSYRDTAAFLCRINGPDAMALGSVLRPASGWRMGGPHASHGITPLRPAAAPDIGQNWPLSAIGHPTRRTGVVNFGAGRAARGCRGVAYRRAFDGALRLKTAQLWSLWHAAPQKGYFYDAGVCSPCARKRDTFVNAAAVRARSVLSGGNEPRRLRRLGKRGRFVTPCLCAGRSQPR